MKVLDKIRLIVYRVHEKGLEILMLDEDTKESRLLEGQLDEENRRRLESEGRLIFLEDVDIPEGKATTIAIEGDWHDIPSIRGLIRKDIKRLERKVKEVVPEVEECTYVALKDAFKKVLPHEYAALKELKDILSTRSMIRNL